MFKMNIEKESWFNISENADKRKEFYYNWRDQLKRTTIKVHELWENTYMIGRPTSHIKSINSMGKAHLETASLLAQNDSIPPESLPSYKYFLSEDYGKLTGTGLSGKNFARAYMGWFKRLIKSFKKSGYDTNRNLILIDVLSDGKMVLSDGNKRINCLEALMKDEEILVMIDDHGLWHRSCLQLINRILKVSYLFEKDKKILYQPAIGYEQFLGTKKIEAYNQALNTIIHYCKDVKEKMVLDAGCCFGYFAFEFVKKGASCIGIDMNGNFLNLARHLSRMYNFDWSNPKFVKCNITSYIQETNLQFDYALMFNVLHHLFDLNSKEAFRTIDRTARKTKNAIFICMRTPSGVIRQQSQIPKLILKNTCLTDFHDLGESWNPKRNLYAFFK